MLTSTQSEYEKLVEHAEYMTPCLVKIEELLFSNRSQCAVEMANYYQHWEKQLYLAVMDMVLANLDAFHYLLNEKKYTFTIRAVLEAIEVNLEPNAATVVEGLLNIVKAILDGTKHFVRFYR